MISADFTDTLEATARAMNAVGHRWVVFGGAAMALHGFETTQVRDIDILVSGEAAADLLARWSLRNHADEASARFRSDYLLRPDFGRVPVEIVGNFRVRLGLGWRKVEIRSPIEVAAGAERLFIPARDELAAIFDLCGRAKDIERSRRLRSLG
jgi:hypothetical protein